MESKKITKVERKNIDINMVLIEKTFVNACLAKRRPANMKIRSLELLSKSGNNRLFKVEY